MNGIQKKLQQAKGAAMQKYMAQENPPGNVVGVGVGKKYKAGVQTSTDSVRIYVLKKREPKDLTPHEMVNPSFGGVPSDVIEIGQLGRRGRKPTKPQDPFPRPGSPIRAKTDAPNVNSGATGTLGIVVAGLGQRYILGCNHILAVNGRLNDDPNAEIVWGKFFGEDETIAVPEIYIPLKRHGANSVDCALARISQPGRVQPSFPRSIERKRKRKPILPRLDMQVHKCGAATGTTEGTIVDISADLYVDYSFGRFLFSNQVVIEGNESFPEVATPGDSGSLVLEEIKNQPVAMIFAASGRFAVACPLRTPLVRNGVLDQLEDELRLRANKKLRNLNGAATLKLL